MLTQHNFYDLTNIVTQAAEDESILRFEIYTAFKISAN